MITAITYGDEQYDLSCRLNLWTAKKIGKADRVRRYSRDDIEQSYLDTHKDIFSVKRGGGLWLWKPYIIAKALNEINDNEYLMYLDSGAFYVDSILKLINQLEKNNQNILFSSSILTNNHWCKKSLIDRYINKDDQLDFMNRSQAESGYILIKKSDETVRFIKEWLTLQEDYENVCDVEDKSKEYKFFKEHRHDQSTLNIIMYWHNMLPNKGFSSRSEYKYYVRFNDGDFFGYSKKELIELAIRESEQEYYKKSDYGRIVINTRIDTTNRFIFALKLIKKVFMSIMEDTVYKWIASSKIEKYKKFSENNKI